MPLAHREGASDLLGGGRLPDQLAEALVLDTLKPVLTDPAILKIGHDVKYHGSPSRCAASR